MKKSILFGFVLLLANGLWAQRIIHPSMRWQRAWGISATGIYGSALQMPAEPWGGRANAGWGAGAGAHMEYQLSLYHRVWASGNVHYRSYVYQPIDPLGIDVKPVQMGFLYFDVDVGFKVVLHAFENRFYAAPGLCLSVEQNHPILNRNSTGIGILGAVGMEHSISRKAFVFVEGQARMLSVVRFKYEEYPWRIVAAELRMGISFSL